MTGLARLSSAAIAVCLISAAAAESSTPGGDAFPGRNGRIAYTAFDRSGARIVAMAPAGGSERVVVPGVGEEGDPAWSRDGRRLAFVRSTPDGRQGLFVYSLGARPRPLTLRRFDQQNPVLDGQPSWSPTGRQVVFHRSRGQTFELYVAAAIGRPRLRRIGEGFEPTWSPDGRKIAFAHRSGAGGNFELYVMSPDGTGRRRLRNSPEDESGADWSPDGRRIVFVRRLSIQEYDIWTMRADGSGQRRLTNAPGPDVDPAWSPDGRKIAFASRRAGRSDVYVMNADGSRQRRLTRKPFDEAQPAWQPLPRRL